MEIYLLIYFLLILFGIFYSGTSKSKKAKLIYCITCSVILIFIMYNRNPSLGNSDVTTYYLPRFNLVKNISYSEVYNRFKDIDPIFYIFTKFIANIFNDFKIYLLICALPLIIGVSKLIYKYSLSPMISYIIFIGLGFYFTAFITLRNSFALGILIFSFDKILEKKPIKFILIVLLASLFHSSALLFLLAYPISKIKFNLNFRWILISLFFVLLTVFSKFSVNFIFNFVSNDHLLLYKTRNVQLNLSLFLEYILLFIVLLLFKSKFMKENKDNFQEVNALYSLSYIGVLLTMLVVLQDVMYRVSAFYSIYLILLIPNSIFAQDDIKSKKFLTILILIFFMLWGLKFAKDLNLIPYF